MKIKSNFTLGLVSGLALSVCLMLITAATTDHASIKQTEAVSDSTTGEYISIQVADSLIGNYSSMWVQGQRLPENTTTGGWIGRANLEHLLSQAGGQQNIKFSFYYTTGEENAPQIGLIFYPSETASAVLRTGSASFCPTVCNSPD